MGRGSNLPRPTFDPANSVLTKRITNRMITGSI
jgi:hypothetical protein